MKTNTSFSVLSIPFLFIYYAVKKSKKASKTSLLYSICFIFISVLYNTIRLGMHVYRTYKVFVFFRKFK